jgi:hypothetical protein
MRTTVPFSSKLTVHQCFHEADSAPVTQQQIVLIRWIWNGATVEPLVTDGDGDYSVHAAPACHANPLVWRVSIVLNHRIS